MMMLSESMDCNKNHKKKMVIFEVDFEKEYDSVNWKYLDYILIQFGFSKRPSHWCKHESSNALARFNRQFKEIVEKLFVLMDMIIVSTNQLNNSPR
uniref:Reverse transcriptase domain-containing protein n=1 Tax=Tanacetum cinerariifolium TaxID=118510 RepID=A0A6L2K090_TANCI|nr:hypothetical protein [Tanacetum cinerariifolium]